MSTTRHPVLTMIIAVATTTGLAVAAPAAEAAVPHHSSARAASPAAAQRAPRLSPARLARVRAEERRMLETSAPPRTLARAAARAGSAVRTFTVTTTDDSDLADPAGVTCADAATGSCSLRAALHAADNLQAPVRIVLARATYTLTSGQPLTTANAAGTAIVGQGSGSTSLQGAGSRVITASPPGPGGPAPLLFLTGLTVTGGTADTGGGIYLGGGSGPATLVTDHVAISGNSATGTGGGIEAEYPATLDATHTTISGNQALVGGGLDTDEADVRLQRVRIVGNQASSSAGGWNTRYGVLRMRGGSISGNSVTDSGGFAGGLQLYAGIARTSGVHVDRNVAGYGGGSYSSQSVLTMTGGTISGNRGTLSTSGGGGGLWAAGGMQADLHGVQLAGNTIPDDQQEGAGGGAIMLDASSDPVQLTLDSGTSVSGSDAGALYAYQSAGGVDLRIDHATFTDDIDGSSNGLPAGCGGAICAYGVGSAGLNLTLVHARFAHNTSRSADGQGSGAVGVAESYGSTRLHVVGSTFEQNDAGSGGVGGAIGVSALSGTATVRLESSLFTRNRAGSGAAAGEGGAVAVIGPATLSDRGSTFTRNRAPGDGGSGGAVYAQNSDGASFTRSTFTRNHAGPVGSGTGAGGALFDQSYLGAALTEVTMARNSATTQGGGIATVSNGYALDVDGSTLSDNVAGDAAVSGQGGGLYSEGSVAVVHNSTLAGNRAVTSTAGPAAEGGGIWSSGGSLGLHDTTVSGNLARHGGGVYAASPGATFVGSILSANRAATGGAESDCAAAPGLISSLGGNVLGQRACAAHLRPDDRLRKNPRLEPLANNGGPTRTMAVRPHSPAVGLVTLQCPATDQRGHRRPSTHCDAGAFELPPVR